MLEQYGNLPNLQFFALSVYEDWLATRWKTVDDQRKSDLISFLFDYLVQSSKNVPYHVYMYLLKIIAQIGRLDWPKRCPWFIDRSLELASTPETCLLGVNLLKIISEEWISTKSRIRSSRRAKLRLMLSQAVPQIISVFTQILGALWTENVQDLGSEQVQVALNHHGQIHHIDLNANYSSNFCNNEAAFEIAKAVFEAMQHYISWAPLNIVLQPIQIDILFKYVLLNDDTSCMALDNLNEMLERNFVPTEISQFLVQLHAASLTLLSKLARDSNAIETMSEEFISKWTQFLNLFVQYHLRRDESFNFSEFLLLFGKYTFLQSSSQGFLDCLDIWEVIFTLLQSHVDSGVSVAAFNDVIVDFTQNLLRSLLFRHNFQQLEKLEATSTMDETALTDDEQSSELDLHINSALTAISLAYSLYPESLQPVLMSKLLEPMGDFANLHTMMSSNLTTEQARNVYFILRDTNTMIRAIALVGSQFVQNFEATFNDATTLINTLVNISGYVKQHDLQKYSPEAARLAAEIFGAMRAFSEWCGTYSDHIQETNNDPTLFDEIISSLITSDVLVLNSRSLGTQEEAANIPELVPLSAAVHLKNLASTVKTPRMASLPPVVQLMEDVHRIAACHTHDIQQHLYTGLTFIYLVPWHSLAAAHQQWDLRSSSFHQFMEGLLQPFEHAMALVINREIASYDSQVKELIDRDLVILTGLLRSSAGYLDRNGLNIIWNTLQNSIKATVELIEFYLDDLPMMFRLLQLHIQVFSVLAPLIPAELVLSIVTALITHLSANDRLEQMLQDTGGFGTAVAQRLLCLLKALISRPQAPFLADVFKFSIDRIYPSILQGLTSVDVEQSFYEVWADILLNHYKFLIQDPEVYRTALACFLRAFQGQDLDIFRLVIGSLIEANMKRNMFSQQIFWTEGYGPMLSTLFHVMVQRTHEPLHEEILKLVFQIIQGAGFEPFFDEFIPSFLLDTTFSTIPPAQKEQLRARLGRDVDPPTLSKNIDSLLSDLAFLSGSLRQ